MKSIRLTTVLSVGTVVGAVAALVLIIQALCGAVLQRMNSYKVVQERVRQMGGAQVVIETAMAMRNKYTASPDDVATIIDSNTAYSPPTTSTVGQITVLSGPNCVVIDHWPAAFSSGAVQQVDIRPDWVLKNLGLRRGQLVFKEGELGYGTRKIADGLWYWGYEPYDPSPKDQTNVLSPEPLIEERL